jgi:hypothetical protein
MGFGHNRYVILTPAIRFLLKLSSPQWTGEMIWFLGSILVIFSEKKSEKKGQKRKK